MESTVDESEDKNLLLVRDFVDKYIIIFILTFTKEEREEHIYKVYNLILKKYIAPENTNFEPNKKTIISTIVKSYLGSVKLGKPNIH